jgi:glycosyltransferase involved in cell wall biosynthesis
MAAKDDAGLDGGTAKDPLFYMSELPDLSIVIIARNEAENIARAIESALRAAEPYPQAEVLLVDSASTDATVEIARRYPINIVRLNPAWFLSAAAGRTIGMRHTRGDLIQYVDGDMELAAGWLEQAVPFLVEHPELAGVTGYRHDIYMRDGAIVHEQDVDRAPHGQPVEVRHFAGAALYRRPALERVGGFNPYLFSEEEPELSMRLRRAGYKLMYIPYLICKNRTLPVNSWEYSVRRLRKNLWLGYGQALRYHLKSGMFWMTFWERGSYAAYLIGVLISIVSLLFALLGGNISLLVAWVLIVAALLAVYAIKKRSLRETWLSLALRTFIVYGAVRGFFIPPRPPEDYPTHVEVVQVCGSRWQIGEQKREVLSDDQILSPA